MKFDFKFIHYKKGIIGYSIFLLILLIIGLTLYFTLNTYIPLSIFGINFIFSFLIYFALVFVYHAFENTATYKKGMVISTLIRFISIILAVGLTILFMYLTNNMSKPNIYYIFISPTLLLVGYLFGNVLR